MYSWENKYCELAVPSSALSATLMLNNSVQLAGAVSAQDQGRRTLMCVAGLAIKWMAELTGLLWCCETGDKWHSAQERLKMFN